MSEHGNVPCACPGTPGLCELPEGRIQQVDTVMLEDLRDGMDELIKNELVLEEDDNENDGLIVDIMSRTENLDQIEEDDESSDEIECNSFFKQSSLLSIKRGNVQNRNRTSWLHVPRRSIS